MEFILIVTNDVRIILHSTGVEASDCRYTTVRQDNDARRVERGKIVPAVTC